MTERIPARRLLHPVDFLALGFGSGLLPFAPGTAGTVAAIPVYLLARRADRVAINTPTLEAVAAGETPENAVTAQIAEEIPTLDRDKYFQIAGAFSIGMFSAIMISTSLGLFLPFLFRHIGLDPAISSGPLVTTANDSISVAIYLLLTMIMTQ